MELPVLPVQSHDCTQNWEALKRQFPGAGLTPALVAGEIVVETRHVTDNALIFLSRQDLGGAAGHLYVSDRVAGESFTVTSSSNTDTSTVAWMVVRP